jgi:hypothetical protein
VDERLHAVAELYDEWRQAAFPRRVILDDEPNGVEVVGLYSRVAGCVHTWLAGEGRADDRLLATLAECEQQLNRAIPALDGYEASYYQRLLDMTVLILAGRRDTQPE